MEVDAAIVEWSVRPMGLAACCENALVEWWSGGLIISCGDGRSGCTYRACAWSASSSP